MHGNIHRRRPLQGVALLLLASALCVAACAVPGPTASSAEAGLVVFSVLDPAAAEQTVLLMQSRAAIADLTARTFNVNDPIVSSGDIPVTGARVVVYGPTGDSAVAIEDRTRRSDGLGAGVYRIFSIGTPATLPAGAYLPITPGAGYTLRVESRVGNASATTRVPSAEGTFGAPARTVDLARDTVLLGDGTVEATAFVYTLRNASGSATEGSPQFRRALERRLVLPSGDEWAFAYARDRLRVGSRHTLTVVAVDSNYFGYYGSEADPFADRTLRTTLRGAAGIFGSVLVLYASVITVVGG